MHKNATKNRLEQLQQLHKMCLEELDQLQLNVERYLQVSTGMVDTLTANWPEVQRQNTLALMMYDNFLTSITNVMNLSRKFNLQLQINYPQNEDKSQIFDMFRGSRQTRADPAPEESKEAAAGARKFVKTTKEICDLSKESKRIDLIVNHSKCLYPAEEIVQEATPKLAEEEFIYPQQKFNDTYTIGSTIEVFVTYLKDMHELKFYAFDFHSEYMDIITEVGQSLELRQYNTLPPAHEVFGLVLDKRILRAVRSPKVLYDQEQEEQLWPCYLLDFGEVEHLKISDIKYKLTERQQQIPALALLCQLRRTDSMEKLQRQLREKEYQKCHLKVVEIKKDVMLVDFIQNIDTNTKTSVNEIKTSTSAKLKETIIIQETNPFRQQADNYTSTNKSLTAEELEMLHEEPALCTSNALTAVLGYNPQDDKRICRFYDPETGTCFKGSNCKQEHTPLHPEGWTKDVLPAVSFVDNRNASVIYPKGAIINVTPTYIGELDSFYAQINDPHHNNSPLIWNDEDVPAWKRLQRPPHIFELVLSCYEDGLWYRAKILAHDDDYKMFKVFYVDYGNHQIVHLRSLAKCDHGMAHIPFQATLCRLAGLRKIDISAEKRKEGLQKICNALLNQSVDVKVVSHHEDLIITFVEESNHCLVDWLIHEGYLTSYTI